MKLFIVHVGYYDQEIAVADGYKINLEKMDIEGDQITSLGYSEAKALC